MDELPQNVIKAPPIPTPTTIPVVNTPTTAIAVPSSQSGNLDKQKIAEEIIKQNQQLIEIIKKQ